MGVLTGVTAIDGGDLTFLRKKRWLRRLLDVVNGWKEVDVLELPSGSLAFRRIGLDKAWYDFPYLLEGFGSAFSSHNTYFLESPYKRIPHKTCDGSYMMPEELVWFLGSVKYKIWATYKKLGLSTKSIATFRTPEFAYMEGKREKTNAATTLIALEGLESVFEVLFERLAKYGEELSDPDEWSDYDGRPFNDDNISYVGHYFQRYLRFLTECVRNEEGDYVLQGVVLSSS